MCHIWGLKVNCLLNFPRRVLPEMGFEKVAQKAQWTPVRISNLLSGVSKTCSKLLYTLNWIKEDWQNLPFTQKFGLPASTGLFTNWSDWKDLNQVKFAIWKITDSDQPLQHLEDHLAKILFKGQIFNFQISWTRSLPVFLAVWCDSF